MPGKRTAYEPPKAFRVESSVVFSYLKILSKDRTESGQRFVCRVLEVKFSRIAMSAFLRPARSVLRTCYHSRAWIDIAGTMAHYCLFYRDRSCLASNWDLPLAIQIRNRSRYCGLCDCARLRGGLGGDE